MAPILDSAYSMSDGMSSLKSWLVIFFSLLFHMDQTDRSHASLAFLWHHQPRAAEARPMRAMAMAGATAIATTHDSAAHSKTAAAARQRLALRA